MKASECKLTASEMFTAAMHGIMRRMNAIKMHREKEDVEKKPDAKEEQTEKPSKQWSYDVDGCAAEMLVGKWLDKFWYGIGNTISDIPADLGNVEVRSTEYENGCLALHEKDKDDLPFVLVVGRYPEMRIVGWIMGRDGKKDKYWRKDIPVPAYFVPQSDLATPDSLLDYLDDGPCVP